MTYPYPLNEALKGYETALNALQTTNPPSPEQIIQVLMARDAVQKILSGENPLEAALLAVIPQLDKRLCKQAGVIVRVVDLAAWRASFNPPTSAWWWFLDSGRESELALLLEQYKTALINLEEKLKNSAEIATSSLSVQVILDVLTVRDALEKQLGDKETPGASLVKVAQLDSRLRKQFKGLSQKISQENLVKILEKLDELCEVAHRPREAWWWWPKIRVHWWDRWDLAWDTLTIIWLAATFSLLTDVSTRFLSGGAGPGLFGSFAVISQTILALMGGGSLTKTGQAVVEGTFKRWGIPRHWWQEAKFLAASGLLLLFVGVRLSLPWVAVVYNNWGSEDYRAKQLDSAQAKFQRAIKLNPDYTEAHYNLGSLYEDIHDLKQAQTHYAIAVQSGSALAHNNLARLYIKSKEKEYGMAVNLLLRGLFLLEDDAQFSEQDKEKLRYSLLKNLGWARLKQNRPEKAKEALKQAVNIKGVPKQASAYCLLAQAHKQLKQQQQALDAWQKCYDYPKDPRNPEEDDWIYEAEKELKAGKRN